MKIKDKESVIKQALSSSQSTEQKKYPTNDANSITRTLRDNPVLTGSNQSPTEAKKRTHPHSWFFRLRSQLHLLTEKEKEAAQHRPSRYIKNS